MANVAQAKLCVKGYGKNFKALRENAKLTQEQLGDILHYSYKTISNIETEQRQPTNEQLLAYKTFFEKLLGTNVSLDYLTGHSKAKDLTKAEMCEYTGLSEKSIVLLNQMSKLPRPKFSDTDRFADYKALYKSYIDIMNELIENGYVFNLLFFLKDLISYSACCMNVSEPEFLESLEWEEQSDHCDMFELKINRLMQTIVDQYDYRKQMPDKNDMIQEGIKKRYEDTLQRIFSELTNQQEGDD